jgi:hypothetical protein
MRVILEIGKGPRRVVAAATDWPGLDRWGPSEEAAIEKLDAYRERYAPVAERAGLVAEFKGEESLRVVERVPGSSSTDFWGVAHVPSKAEAEVLSEAGLERRLALVQATWDCFHNAATRSSFELLPGSRGGGRSRDQIVEHVYGSERHQFWRKVGLRADEEVKLSPAELADLRGQFVELIRSYNVESKPARTWPIQFLLRRVAHHAMDHAWEIEDRDIAKS